MEQIQIEIDRKQVKTSNRKKKTSRTQTSTKKQALTKASKQTTTDKNRKKLIADLRKTLKSIKLKISKGYIPVCASCKKIQDNEGLWIQSKDYSKKNGSASKFTHCICPPCKEKLYPDRVLKKRRRKAKK